MARLSLRHQYPEIEEHYILQETLGSGMCGMCDAVLYDEGLLLQGGLPR